MKPRRIPGILGSVVIGIVWLSVAGLLLEVGSRMHHRLSQSRNQLLAAELERRVSLQVALDDSFWEVPFDRYRKNLDIATDLNGRRFRFQTDTRGFRTREMEIPKPPDVFRIVCVGASTTVEGETNETTYPARMEARLHELMPDRTIEVVNCGISAFAAAHELERLPAYLAYEPDLLVEYNCINDLTAIAERFLKRAPAWHKWVRRSHFASRVLASRMQRPEADVRKRIDGFVFESHAVFLEKAAAAGVPVVFASFLVVDPDLATPAERDYLDFETEVDWGGPHFRARTLCSWVSLYNEQLMQFCRENGVSYLPLAEEMRGEMRYFIDLCHMTPEGIERKAEIFARHLAPLIAASEGRPARTEG